MKLQNLKVGDVITHYCAGRKVQGTVIATGRDFVRTEHPAVRWGNDDYQTSEIYKSSEFQRSTSQTTPGAWYNGRKLTA